MRTCKKAAAEADDPADAPAGTAASAAAADAADEVEGDEVDEDGAIADALMVDDGNAPCEAIDTVDGTPQIEEIERCDAAAMEESPPVDDGGDDAAGGASDPGTDDDETYEVLMADLEKKEDDEFNEMLEGEEEKMRDSEAGEAIVDADLCTNDMLASMRSMYVTDPSGQQIHKKTLLKQIGAGKTLVKSFDRTKRVRGDARKGGAGGAKDKDGKIESVVTKAYQYDGTSGEEVHRMGDYCCVLAKARTSSSQTNSANAKSVQMLVGKLHRFGDGKCLTPQNYEWPVAKTTFRASVRVCQMKQYVDANGHASIRHTGKMLGELRNANSSSIVTIKPSLEEAWSPEAAVSVTYAVMKVEELAPIFQHLLTQKKFYESKSDTVFEPIRIDGKNPFVAGKNADCFEGLPTCNVCSPPMVIGAGKAKYTAIDIQRSLRNHMGLHILEKSFDYEPCAFCCQKNCRLHVEMTENNKKAILKDPKGAKIPAGAFVHHNCETYPSLEPFQYKYSKPIQAYPCSNVPMLCHACDVTNFIWSYNMDVHYDNEHPGMKDKDWWKYYNYLMDDEKKEMKAIREKFVTSESAATLDR